MSLSAPSCSISTLEMFLNKGVNYVLSSPTVNGMVTHYTRATLSCTFPMTLRGSPETTCVHGEWRSASERSCGEIPTWLVIAFLIIAILVVTVGVLVVLNITYYYYRKKKIQVTQNAPQLVEYDEILDDLPCTEAAGNTSAHSSIQQPRDALMAEKSGIVPKTNIAHQYFNVVHVELHASD